MKKTAFMLIAALMLAACAKETAPKMEENVPQEPTEELAPGTVLLKAVFEQPYSQSTDAVASRVNVSDAGAITWKTGDDIAVWTTNGVSGKFCTFTLYTGNGETEATFTGTPDDGYSASTLAVYPAAAAVSYAESTLTVSYPSSYSYGEGNTNVRMAAYFADPEDGLSFKHLGGLIRFSLTNIPATANCFKLISDKAISGNFAVETVSENKQVSSSAAAADEVEITFEAGSLSSGGTFSVPVPVGTFDLSAALYVKDGSSYTLFRKSQRSTEKTVARTDYIQMRSYAVVAGGTYYVKTAAAGSKDGSSWANATTLEQALYWAEDGETIKMAAGTYKAASIPEIYASAGPADPITEGDGYKFYLVTSHITVEGGYAGSSESESPDYATNTTTIDGSLGAYHGLGIAAQKTDGKKVSIKGLTITNCTYQDGAPGIRTKDNIFLAGLGAAIVARDTRVEFDNCIITGNTATAGSRTDLCTVYGGGDEAEINFKNCEFSSNTNGAAVIYNHSSSISLSEGSTVSGNTGRVFNNADADSESSMTGGSIHDNTYSGAAAVIFNRGTAVFNGVDIYHNSGTYALLYNYNSTTGLTVSACDIYENTLSATSAGAILWSNSPLTVNDGTTVRDHTGSYAFKGNGGALYTTGAATLDHVRIKDNSGPNMVYVDNTAASASADSLTVTGNSVTNAGGLFNNAGGLLSINRAVIKNNTSTGVGVVLQAYKRGVDSYTYISNSIIAQNSGTQRTLYLREKSHTVLTNCTIYANPTSTASQGGAIVLYGASSAISQAYLISCTITGNGYNSGTCGGLQMYNTYTEAHLYNTMVAGNRGSSPRDMNPDHAGVQTKAYCALGNSSTLYRAAAFYGSDSSEITGENINWEDGQYYGGEGASSRYTKLFNGSVVALNTYSGAKPVGNPLMELGMPYSSLTAIADPFDKGVLTSDILGADQLGNSRSGLTYMGAYVGE